MIEQFLQFFTFSHIMLIIYVLNAAIAFGLMLMLYFPIIFISMHVKSINKNSAAAEDYIRRHQAVAFA